MKLTLSSAILTCFLIISYSILPAQNPTFTNQSNMLGSFSGFSYSNCAVDMNGDYLDDVVRVTGNSIVIDYQDPVLGMTQTVHSVNMQNSPSWSICAGDIDGNGYNDLCFGDGNRASFIYADSTGSNYTEDAFPEYIFCQRSTFSDVDNDGNLDAFICHDVDQSHPYRNDGSGVLSYDTSLIHTIDLPGNYAAIWVDYDGDWDNDLYITKCRGGASPGDPARTNGLYRNNGDGTYTECAAQHGLDDNAQSWATVFEDFDNDGDFDVFIVNHDFQNRLYCNMGNGTFVDTIASSGINANDLGAWENASGDFNNDGYVDIFSELQNHLYLGNGDLTFTAAPLSFQNGGIGDFNDDGFLDVISGNNLWINDGNSNHYVKVTLQGVVSNWNGIGSRVEIHGSWGIQVREIRAGQSFSPMSTLNAHFGIGAATAIDSIVIKWPSGIKNVVTSPAIDQAHHVIEGPSTSVQAPVKEKFMKLFPNPAYDRVEFMISEDLWGDAHIRILNVDGQIVLERDYIEGQAPVLDISTVRSGVYFVEYTAGETVISKKLTVVK